MHGLFEYQSVWVDRLRPNIRAKLIFLTHHKEAGSMGVGPSYYNPNRASNASGRKNAKISS